MAGPRQVGKTTLVQQVLAEFGRPNIFVSADEPALRDAAWPAAQWERARLLAKDAGMRGAVLALDEVQKVPGWSEAVKRLKPGRALRDPAPTALAGDPARWRRYLLDALVETTISCDVLLLTRRHWPPRRIQDRPAARTSDRVSPPCPFA